MNNPMQMFQQFQQFRQNFTGNPQQEVQKLLATGKMNQQQLNQLQSIAAQFQQMFNIR